MHGELMAAEIAAQPAVLARIIAEGRPHIAAAGRAIRARAPRFVLFVARGTSDHAVLYAKYLVETRLGLPAGLVSPSTMTVYDARPALRDVLFIAVSQSGGSPDLLEPLTRARRRRYHRRRHHRAGFTLCHGGRVSHRRTRRS